MHQCSFQSRNSTSFPNSIWYLVRTRKTNKCDKDLHDEFVRLANSRGNAANGAPGVHDGLASCDRAASLQSAILEASHHLETRKQNAIVDPIWA